MFILRILCNNSKEIEEIAIWSYIIPIGVND